MKIFRERILKVVAALFIGSLFLLVGAAQVSAAQDLAVRITQCPQSAKAGQDLNAGFQVLAHLAGGPAVKEVAVDIVLKRNASCPVPAPYAVCSPNYSDGVLLKGGREHVSLDPGQTLNVKLNGTNTIPADTPTGNYFLCAVIDAGNKVKEGNEQNNCACCPVKIIAAAGKPEITAYREKCGAKGSNVTILGKNFGTQTGKGVALGGHGIHVDLPVVSWNANMIIAKIPNDPKIQEGQWYYIGIERADHGEWLSNIDKNITICVLKK
jgi:CARDB